jgi:exopolysaccharide biosynthesis polyprenyl glycosylphosphotransferase
MRLFKVFFPTRAVALLFSEIAIILGCYLAAAFLSTEAPNVFLFDDGGLYRIGLVTACIVVGFYLNDLYSQLRVRSKSTLLQQVCFVLGIAFVIQSLLGYLKLGDWALPRWTMIYGSVLLLLVQPGWRILYDRMVLRRLASDKVLFLGASPVARMVAERLSDNPQFGLSVAGYLEDPPASDDLPANLLLGPVSRLREVVEELKPQRIIVGMTDRDGRPPVHDLLDLRFSGTDVEDVQTTYEDVYRRVSVKELLPSRLIFETDLGPHPRSEFLQGVYSFGLALAGFLIASPVMLLVALLVRLTSPGPVLHRQLSAGKNGATFTLLKFRSMFHDAGTKNGAASASRVTPLGRWLRFLRLDELPQSINVLRGDMLIVGPRPERPEFVKTLAEQIPCYHQRLAVKPGITGWAQVNHKSGDTLEDTLLKLEYDLYYIKNVNMTLDIYIMFQTAKVMLSHAGQ